MMTAIPGAQYPLRFDGATYDPAKDKRRLGAQAQRVWDLMIDGKWRTLRDISIRCQGSENSVNARLRDFRKERFGGHVVDRRRTDVPGVFEYRLEVRG